MKTNYNSVALIPARSGSKRIKDKNIIKFSEHPLLAYSIEAALASQEFEDVVCVTDSERYAEVARYYGATVPEIRPLETASEYAPDISWVKWILNLLESKGKSYYTFSILRPTSPFRTSLTIKRAFKKFFSNENFESIRAVELCKQHPGKMWIQDGELLEPLLRENLNGIPWHSSQYAVLPKIYVQNASLEISLSDNALLGNSISGHRVGAFFTEGYEGFDINIEDDIILGLQLLNLGQAKTQYIAKEPYK